MRKVIHIDMDCFYAAVEMRDNPELRNQPIAVGGRPGGRGVVATCNYLAREFGVRSAMPAREAQKRCPNLVFVTPRMNVYKAESQTIRAIFYEYTTLVEPLSLDEAYLDVSSSPHCQGSATRMAAAIREKIYAQTQLTASAGIAQNKLLAKVASDLNKPNGQFVVAPADVADFVVALPVKKIPGVGKVMQRKLQEMLIETCGDMQAYSQEDLIRHFGKFGSALYGYCRGEDNRRVSTDRTRKSVSVERTFDTDYSAEHCEKLVLPSLLVELKQRLERQKVSSGQVNGVVLKLRCADFTTTTIERSGFNPSIDIYQQLLTAAAERMPGKFFRLVGLGVKLAEKPAVGAPVQLNLEFEKPL